MLLSDENPITYSKFQKEVADYVDQKQIQKKEDELKQARLTAMQQIHFVQELSCFSDPFGNFESVYIKTNTGREWPIPVNPTTASALHRFLQGDLSKPVALAPSHTAGDFNTMVPWSEELHRPGPAAPCPACKQQTVALTISHSGLRCTNVCCPASRLVANEALAAFIYNGLENLASSQRIKSQCLLGSLDAYRFYTASDLLKDLLSKFDYGQQLVFVDGKQMTRKEFTFRNGGPEYLDFDQVENALRGLFAMLHKEMYASPERCLTLSYIIALSPIASYYRAESNMNAVIALVEHIQKFMISPSMANRDLEEPPIRLRQRVLYYIDTAPTTLQLGTSGAELTTILKRVYLKLYGEEPNGNPIGQQSVYAS